MRDHLHHVPIEPIDDAEDAIAESSCAFSYGVENRLYVSRRLADHAQDLGRGRLLVQGFAHLGMGLRERRVLLLQLREQPHVLDGDDGLVGEGLEKCGLAFGERSGLGTPNGDAADHFTPVQYWDPNRAAAAERDTQGLEIFDVYPRVRYMAHSSLENDTAEDGRSRRAHREHLFGKLNAFRSDIGVRYQMEQVTIVGRDVAEVRIAQTHRAFRNGIEHRLNVSGRATDDSQDLRCRRLLVERRR